MNAGDMHPVQKVPPLSQSRYGDMACETLYIQKHICCAKVGDSEPAARGIEIHEILATYINHLVRTRRSTDLEIFQKLMDGASIQAREALERFQGNHAIDPDRIVATELHIALSRDFLPIDVSGYTDEAAEYEGTLGVVMLDSVTEAEIWGWKSYYQIIDADTFQSKFYPLLLMCLNPSIERVRFVLEFIRYGPSRSAEYTREDLPRLKDLARKERLRQKKLHELASLGNPDMKTSPGRHCTWCPLLLNGCPVAKTNPYAQMSAVQRLAFALWLKEAEKQNTKVLKDSVIERGPVCHRDANGTEYFAAFVPAEKRSYPYERASAVLGDWFRTHPDECGLRDRLTKSSLSSALKAAKRNELAAKLLEIAEVQVDTELSIGPASSANPKLQGQTRPTLDNGPCDVGT